LIALLAVLASERIRYEVAACIFLAAGYLLGIVPAEGVFAGFAHPAVITVAEILILVAALQSSALMKHLSGLVLTSARGPQSLLVIICLMGAGLSVFMNNIGALALMMPLAISVAVKTGISQKFLLMPLSFATLLGGTCSMIGTPANLIVSDVFQERMGETFRFFEFATLGVPAMLAGLAVIFVWSRFVFRSGSVEGMQDASASEGSSSQLLVTEYTVPMSSAWVGRNMTDLGLGEDVTIASVVRDGRHVFARPNEIRLEPGDTLYLQAPATWLQDRERTGDLKPAIGQVIRSTEQRAVVLPQSIVLGSRIANLESFADAGVVPVAVVTHRRRLEGRFHDLQLGIGDVVHMHGPAQALTKVAEQTGLLLLQAPDSADESDANWSVPVIFLASVTMAAFGLLSPELAFGTAIIILAALGKLDITLSLHRLNWPIIILLAAMIPLGTAVETTGAATVIAGAIANVLSGHGDLAVLLAILLSAIIITPFVNNASTAIVLAPIAMEIAFSTGLDARIALIAVGVGVSLDFLTPFGHHNNTIAMSVGGYRFTDFGRLGFPVLLASVGSIIAFYALSG